MKLSVQVIVAKIKNGGLTLDDVIDYADYGEIKKAVNE